MTDPTIPPMSDALHTVLRWFGFLFHVMGLAGLWTAEHASQIAGLASVVFGLFLQYLTYRIKVEEWAQKKLQREKRKRS